MRLMTVSGRIGQDVTPQLSRQGTQFISFSIASQEFSDERDSDGNLIPKWIRVTAFDSRLITLAKHLKKGKPIIVTGDYTDKKYQNQRTGAIEIDRSIIATNINFEIGSERQQTTPNAPSATTASPTKAAAQVSEAVDEIPQATSRKMTKPKVAAVEPQAETFTPDGVDDDLPF